MKKLKGYVFSRKFNGNLIPQKIQNIILRDYCNKKRFHFIMSSIEYSIKNSFIILNKLVKDLNKYDGIVAYSIFQLPDKQKERIKVYKKIMSKRKEFHFVLEDIVISKNNIKNFNFIEETISVKKSINESNIIFKKLKNYI